MLGLPSRPRAPRPAQHTLYRTPTGELVEFVKRHGHPSAPGGVWVTAEDSDGYRRDYPAPLLAEVR